MVLFQNNTYPWERKCVCVCVCVCVHACMCACMCVCNITCKSNRSKTLSTIHADAWGNLCSTAKQKSPWINSNNNKSMPVTFLNIHRQDLHLLLMPVTNPTSKLDWTRIKQTQLAVYVSNTHDCGSLPVNVRDALGRPWLPQIPGLTPGEGGSPHLHNAQSYYVFNLSLPKCVGDEPRPPPPPQLYGPFPDVKGALGSPVNEPLAPTPSPPHSRPLPAQSWGF